MKTIVIEGLIKRGTNGSFDTIYIVDKDGWEIDLVDKFIEIGNNGVEKLQVNYFISDTPKTLSEAKSYFIKKLYGGYQAEKESTSCSGSSWTGGWTEHDTELFIGGHNLQLELGSSNGNYIAMEINFKFPVK